MKLFIVRHAIAVPHGAPGIADDDRPLTEEGRQKMKRAAMGIRSIGWEPEMLLSSPLIRARQTAEILLDRLGKKCKCKVASALAPSGSHQTLYREIGFYEGKAKSLMLVGHQPNLGEIVGEICWGSPESFVEIKKGGACEIELEIRQSIPKGRLVSLFTPSILRLLAEK
jgi:phosphohistidine phosphatase